MNQIRVTLLIFVVMLSNVFCINAQVLIHGEVRQMSDQQLMDNVNVRNIHSGKGSTISKGDFSIEVKKGELIEFTKVGYQTVRIRITSEIEPLFYKVVMDKVPILLREVDIKGKPLDFKRDSIRYHETYKIVLRKQKMDEVDMRSMPLAMLSKKNRQEWAFQEMYAQWEEEKFIDFVFNEKLVTRITYLSGDLLKEFMNTYRPSYAFLRNVSDYEYLDYIKSSYFHFKGQKGLK